eukprot:scaffold1753_cov153-Pinguiococcus_pyrenoidosus.AAC.3
MTAFCRGPLGICGSGVCGHRFRYWRSPSLHPTQEALLKSSRKISAVKEGHEAVKLYSAVPRVLSRNPWESFLHCSLEKTPQQRHFFSTVGPCRAPGPSLRRRWRQQTTDSW